MLLLLAIPAFFVGNQACSGCHAGIYKSYSLTPMANTSGPAGSVSQGSFRHAASGYSYDVDARGMVRFSKAKSRGEQQLDYYIGSGAAGRSYLYQRAGFLFEAPITWYARTRAWDASPGYEADA